jgi:mono/diheme cytochrome c family protein
MLQAFRKYLSNMAAVLDTMNGNSIKIVGQASDRGAAQKKQAKYRQPFAVRCKVCHLLISDW